ncbi:sensor histidine kinase [Croceicoccus gelatinilyticus]|uniref:sensor histidine kinase n=1 Tax=Croceicoccus gelatinilyticus TaxID=2835536 RepID=UPI001BCFD8D2|nr:PAS domain-containing sensor histidine kinase [Croceicoccus gelatinilyticus]MBS7669292.1 PAS domain-containing sensor histidine kinase [Croceicoccus gelatinilyticus]
MTDIDRIAPPPPDLDLRHLGLGSLEGSAEDMWIDVIRQMDTVYADLVKSQTALEQQHGELAEAHDFIGSVLDAMTDIVVACDAGGTIQQANRALETIVGETEQVLLGRSVVDLFVSAERDAVRSAMADAGEGRPIDQREFHLASPDGEQAAISLNIAARHDGDGRLAGLVIVGRPLGELQRAYRELDAAHQKLTQTQEQLLMSEKMAALGRLVAGVAHELNNPISFVFGNMYALKRYGEAITKYLEATADAPRDPRLDALRDELRIDRILGDINPLVEGTLEGAERVRDIVQDLRRFSSSQKEEPEGFDLVKLVHTAADWVLKAQRSKPEIVCDMPEKLEITSRKGQVHQIVVNLIQNACDAVEERDGACITVTCGKANGVVRLTVADNGPGITPENLAMIFEPFFTTKPIGAGTGLGLYVSYNMAVKMGGTIAYSDAPGGGACFALTLPDEGGHGE